MAACHRAPPPILAAATPPTCATAAEHVRVLIGPERPRAARIRDVVAERCESDGWAGDVRACMVNTQSLRRPQHCKAMLTVEQRLALEGALETVASSRVPPPCVEYQAMLDRLGTCPAMPPALVDGYRKALREWTRPGAGDAGTVAAHCRGLVNDLTRAVAASCGW